MAIHSRSTIVLRTNIERPVLAARKRSPVDGVWRKWRPHVFRPEGEILLLQELLHSIRCVCLGTIMLKHNSDIWHVEGVIDQGNQLVSKPGLVVPCSQSIPGQKPDQSHHCAIVCNEAERHDGCWKFRFAGSLFFFPKRQVAVVSSASHRINRPSLLIWEDDHLSSLKRLEVFNEHLATFKALGADSRREQWNFSKWHGTCIQV